MVDDARIGIPPDKRRQRCDHHFDIHAGGPDSRPFPFARKHPAIGDIAVQTRRKNKKHHPHLVALAPKLLARKTVAKFVNHLGDTECNCQIEPVAGAKKLMEFRKL